MNLNQTNWNNILVPKKQKWTHKKISDWEQIMNSSWTNWNNVVVPKEQEGRKQTNHKFELS
jgi:hypothetical protein